MLLAEGARNLLTERGLKATHQRVVILQALSATESHPSAEELFADLRHENPTLSIGTLYKTLEAFVSAGLARPIVTISGAQRFEVPMREHHHLICRKTKQVIDFEDHALSLLLADFFRQNPIPGFQVEEVQLMVTGHKQEEEEPLTSPPPSKNPIN